MSNKIIVGVNGFRKRKVVETKRILEVIEINSEESYQLSVSTLKYINLGQDVYKKTFGSRFFGGQKSIPKLSKGGGYHV